MSTASARRVHWERPLQLFPLQISERLCKWIWREWHLTKGEWKSSKIFSTYDYSFINSVPPSSLRGLLHVDIVGQGGQKHYARHPMRNHHQQALLKYILTLNFIYLNKYQYLDHRAIFTPTCPSFGVSHKLQYPSWIRSNFLFAHHPNSHTTPKLNHRVIFCCCFLQFFDMSVLSRSGNCIVNGMYHRTFTIYDPYTW